MRRRSVLALAALLATAALTATVSAQAPPVSIKQATTDNGTLTVVAAVVDGNGRPVAGLESGAFALQVDGAAAAVRQVRYATDPAVGLGLVLAIDVSGSMAGPRIDSARRAATAFLNTLGPADQVALLVFNQDVAYFSDFTQDRGRVQALIQSLGAAGNTALYRATIAAVEKAAAAPLPRKAVVLVTDGENVEPGGTVTRDAAVAGARAAGVPIYGIGLGSEADQLFLVDLGQATRGDALFAPGPADLDRMYRSISEALRGQYVIEARPDPVRRAASHVVKLVVTNPAVTGSDQITIDGAGLTTLPDPTPVPTPAPATPAAVVTAVPTVAPTPVRADVPADSGGRSLLLPVLVLVALGAGGAGVWLIRRARQEHVLEAEAVPARPASIPQPLGAERPEAATATLRLCAGPLSGMEVAVGETPVTIGSSEDCSLVLPAEAGIDRRHARVWQRDGRTMLHRLGRNGTVEIGGRAVEWVVLDEGDEFTIGPHRFRFSAAPMVAARLQRER